MAWLKTTNTSPNSYFHRYGKSLLLICLLAIVVLVIGYHCPFYAVTHIRCPGCGMTRALIALLMGNWRLSLTWHPMLIPSIILGLLVFLLWKKNRKAAQILVWIWISAMLVCWIYRLIYVFPYDYIWMG